MIWVLSISFVIMLYIFGVTFFMNPDAALICGEFLLIIGIINIVFSIKYTIKSTDHKKDRIKMRRVMLFMKLLTIPFFVMNFLIWVSSLGLFLIFPGGIIILPFLVPILVLLTFVILLVTSSYSISTIVLYGKSKRLEIIECVIHIILQLIFVLDVIDAICLVVILRKRDLITNESHNSY